MKKRYYDFGYLIEDALRRGFWAALFLAALFLVVSGAVTL